MSPIDSPSLSEPEANQGIPGSFVDTPGSNNIGAMQTPPTGFALNRATVPDFVHQGLLQPVFQGANELAPSSKPRIGGSSGGRSGGRSG